jgi:hypothetical protein
MAALYKKENKTTAKYNFIKRYFFLGFTGLGFGAGVPVTKLIHSCNRVT